MNVLPALILSIFETRLLATGETPADDAIREKAAEVIARADYDLTSGVDPESQSLFLQIILWILTPFIWLFQALAGIPDFLRWIIVVGLAVLLVGLIAHIVWTFAQAMKGTARPRSMKLTRKKLTTPEDMEQAAESAEAQGDFIGAVRCLFHACLLRIQRAEKKTLRKGITNREILRRYRKSPLFDPLRHFVEVIDTKWYGHEICQREDLIDCQQQHATVREITERRTHAVSS